MPYTDDPAANPLDTVRFFVGDKNPAAQELSDGEVQFLLSEENGDALRAAARAAESLAAKYAGTADEKQVGPLRIIHGSRRITKSERYMKLARSLWARAIKRSTVPYAGGTNVTDKKGNVSDLERVKPAFGRDMMRYPAGSAVSTGDDNDSRLR